MTTEQETRQTGEASEVAAPAIDTSRMSEGQRAALEMTEAAREAAGSPSSGAKGERRHGFAATLFMGRPDFAGLVPFPRQGEGERLRGDRFLEQLDGFFAAHVDPDAIDASGEIPDHVIEGLAGMGAFGIKIPEEYGGLGLGQTNYSRAAMRLGGLCGNLTALLSAHQSIGLPQPLIAFGTPEQKAKYLPECAAGAISAFALTERDVGSDPARMKTTATPTDDGTGFILNGEKLWCTNGTKARYIVVMAKTPTQAAPHATTAFIVDTRSPGVEVVRRCHFMGLRALYNGVIRLRDVRVGREDIIHAEGRGLRVALTTLNTGRITLPAAAAGLVDRCLQISTSWASGRVQWGQSIGRHAAIADKLARMEAHRFAIESMVYYISALVDADKKADIRIEAALAKLWGTEKGWQAIDDTMQIRGGRGYETVASLKARDESADPVERFFRDARINTIFEGSSEIMRLFVAREAMDPHLRLGAAALNTTLPIAERLASALQAGLFYARWYPARLLPLPARNLSGGSVMDAGMRRELAAVNAMGRRLGRSLFHAMALNGPKLEREQLLLGRLVDAGAQLFALAAAASRAGVLLAELDAPEREHLRRTVRYLSLETRSEFARLIGGGASGRLRRRLDRASYKLGRSVLERAEAQAGDGK
jgi:alkylation response protein AidB-like acyl-CoA dehydrogenase